jgi:hypothetical protein
MIISGNGFVDRRSAVRIRDFETRGGARVRSDTIDLSMRDGRKRTIRLRFENRKFGAR